MEADSTQISYQYIEQETFLSFLNEIHGNFEYNFDECSKRVNSHYKCYKTVKYLEQLVRENKTISTSLLDKLEIEFCVHASGRLVIFLYKYLARSYKEVGELKKSLAAYFLATKFLENHLTLETLTEYENLIDEMKITALDLESYSSIIRVIKKSIDTRNKYGIKLKPETYFDLGLLEKKLGNYKIANVYLDEFINLNDSISDSRMNRVQIIKAGILCNINKIDEAFKIYSKLIMSIDIDEDIVCLSLVCNNIIHYVIKNKVKGKEELLSLAIYNLKEIAEEKNKSVEEKYEIYSTIGRIYGYKECYQLAYESFETCFKKFSGKPIQKEMKYLTVINESFEVYNQLNSLDVLYERFSRINNELLSIEHYQMYHTCKAKFMENNYEMIL